MPQAKLDDVLTPNGTVFVPLAPTAIFGYGEFGWEMTTPGVVVESSHVQRVALAAINDAVAVAAGDGSRTH